MITKKRGRGRPPTSKTKLKKSLMFSFNVKFEYQRFNIEVNSWWFSSNIKIGKEVPVQGYGNDGELYDGVANISKNGKCKSINIDQSSGRWEYASWDQNEGKMQDKKIDESIKDSKDFNEFEEKYDELEEFEKIAHQKKTKMRDKENRYKNKKQNKPNRQLSKFF